MARAVSSISMIAGSRAPLAACVDLRLIIGIMETTLIYWGYIGIVENKLESIVASWDYIGIMENKMETIIY